MAFYLREVLEQQSGSSGKGDDEHSHFAFPCQMYVWMTVRDDKSSELHWISPVHVRKEPKQTDLIDEQNILSKILPNMVHISARLGNHWVGEVTFWSLNAVLLSLRCPFAQTKACGLSLTGTFGRIFHGVLLDEKDPSKEKQVFVKTVKGMHFYPGCRWMYSGQSHKK